MGGVLSLGSQNLTKITTTPVKENSPVTWDELPCDITANILQRLGAVEILTSAQYVCTAWRNLCKETYMWRVIDMRYPCSDIYDVVPYNLEAMCRYAVDRSQGQLIGIQIVRDGTDQLLRYISQRSSQLRCLSLAFCKNISSKGLIEVITRFPNLEELHLIFMLTISPQAIKSIGLLCPNLKSFSFNRAFPLCPRIENNVYTLPVAESMRGLRHLKLFGNTMTNDAIRAILYRCPHLESLDLRHCLNVDLLAGTLGVRCSKQIRDLRRPGDSTDDYEWIAQTLKIAQGCMSRIAKSGLMAGIKTF